MATLESMALPLMLLLLISPALASFGRSVQFVITQGGTNKSNELQDIFTIPKTMCKKHSCSSFGGMPLSTRQRCNCTCPISKATFGSYSGIWNCTENRLVRQSHGKHCSAKFHIHQWVQIVKLAEYSVFIRVCMIKQVVFNHTVNWRRSLALSVVTSFWTGPQYTSLPQFTRTSEPKTRTEILLRVSGVSIGLWTLDDRALHFIEFWNMFIWRRVLIPTCRPGNKILYTANKVAFRQTRNEQLHFVSLL